MDSLKKRWLIVLGLAALIVGGSFWGNWQKAAAPARLSTVTPAVQPAAPMAGAPLVRVSGAVKNPGEYRVGPDSKTLDVINAAGGLAPGADANRIDLAQTVKDGMQIYVPQRIPAGAGTAVAGKVNINTAAKDELDGLPGIGPVLAERIIKYRKAHGPFKDIAELKNVSGIGEIKFNRLKDKITL